MHLTIPPPTTDYADNLSDLLVSLTVAHAEMMHGHASNMRAVGNCPLHPERLIDIGNRVMLIQRQIATVIGLLEPMLEVK